MPQARPRAPTYAVAVEPARPLPWLVLALAAGVVGWFLGRWSAPGGEGGPGKPDARPAATSRSGPTLEGAPSRSGSRAPEGPARGAPRPEEAAPAEAPPNPDGGAETTSTNTRVDAEARVHSGSMSPGKAAVAELGLREEILSRWHELHPGASAPGEDTVLTEVMKLMASDPESANARVEGLLESGQPDDRQRAYRALAQARHPLHRRLAQRALEGARPDDDVLGLMSALARFKGRDWSAAQMTGPPDTPLAGDLPTAWASKEQDMGEVWLEFDFPESVRPERLRIHETFHPGAVARVYVMSGEPDSDEAVIWIEAWHGNAPTPEAPAWFEIPLEASDTTSTIRVIVDTSRVGGWNEIDAVELLGDGRRQWAVAARAGSSYGE